MSPSLVSGNTMGARTDLKNTIIKCSSCNHANIFNQPYPYHAGFSDQGFLYNDAGNLTLTWSCYDPAFERVVGSKAPWTLTIAQQKKLEEALLPAPSDGRWRFSNPARCLSCGEEISGPMTRSIYYLLYGGSIQTNDPSTHDLLLSEQLQPNA